MEAISLKTRVNVMILALLLGGVLFHPEAARAEGQEIVAEDHRVSNIAENAVPGELPIAAVAQSVELSETYQETPMSREPAVNFESEGDGCFQECAEFCPEDCEDACGLGLIACGACLVACDIGCAIGCEGV